MSDPVFIGEIEQKAREYADFVYGYRVLMVISLIIVATHRWAPVLGQLLFAGICCGMAVVRYMIWRELSTWTESIRGRGVRYHVEADEPDDFETLH